VSGPAGQESKKLPFAEVFGQCPVSDPLRKQSHPISNDSFGR